MSTDTDRVGHRTTEEKLESLIERDVTPEITEMAENALQYYQEDESS